MKQDFIPVQRTATIYTLGNKKAAKVFILFHGYGQTAEEFLNEFSYLASDETFLICPEGLSKFYTKGIQGSIGASWMTSLNRENEINDYTKYINKVTDHYLIHKKEINIIAFSQGVSTFLRWNLYSKQAIKKAFLIAGSFPKELSKDKLSINEIFYFRGNKDRLIPDNLISEIKNNFDLTVCSYEGKHQINEALNQLLATKL